MSVLPLPFLALLEAAQHAASPETPGAVQPTAVPLTWTRAELTSIINAINKFSAATGLDAAQFFHLLEGGPFVLNYFSGEKVLYDKLKSCSNFNLRVLLERLRG